VKRLTLKERRFVAAYIETGNATEAALTAYDCTYGSARSIDHQNLAKLHIRAAIELELRANEVNPRLMAAVLADALLDPSNRSAQIKAWDRCAKLLGLDI
jgi:phage terminase small subunit